MTELLLLAQIAGERVAFRAADIQSVVELTAITAVPLSPDFVIGLAALRSRPLTVIDSARALELDQGGTPETSGIRRAVVVEQDKHLYALLVDAIEDVVAAESEPMPPPGRLAPGWERAALGIIETGLGAMLLLDPMAILTDPERAQAA